MRAPVDHIAAPPFPPRLPWINTAPLRIHDQLGRPVLIEFWDFCRANSIRTLPYLRGWHERYSDAGLRVIAVHAAGFQPSRDPDAVRAAVARLEIPYPVVVDVEYQIWQDYGNLGWPGRYLFNQQGALFDQHYGEGAYDETECSIQELLGIDRPLLPTVRPEDAPGAVLEPQSEDVEGPYSGPYRAGGVWAVLDGNGRVTVGRGDVGEHEVGGDDVNAGARSFTIEAPGCYELISHPRSTEGELQLALDPDVRCHAVCFTPGLAPGRRAG